MPPHKVALIGTGGRSVGYARAYQQRDDVEITGLADPDPAHRRYAAARASLDKGIAEYDDFRDLLREQPDLDGVVICSPNHLHAEHAVACLERGLPIALEKPLAPTKEACERVIAAERSNGAAPSSASCCARRPSMPKSTSFSPGDSSAASSRSKPTNCPVSVSLRS